MTKPPAVVGVDPGLSGGFALLTLDARDAFAFPLPVVQAGKRRELDVAALADALRGFLLAWDVRLAAVEKVHAMPKQGVSSTFSFGLCYGAIRGVLGTLGIPVELPTPQHWQKTVLAGMGACPDTKTASVAYCTRRFPGVSLKASPRCRVAHDGMADALCISEFARRLAHGK